MPKYYDIEQGSDEWFNLRLGKITSSHFAEIMAYSIDKKGDFDDLAKWGVGAKDYAIRLALEQITGKRIDTFSNNWMKQGSELEPIAREKYECKTFQLVKNGGLIISDKKKAGDGLGEFATSPDGLIISGGIEIKCVKQNTHYNVIEAEYYDIKYKWQIQGQMLIADLDYVDFVSYCADYPPETELFIFKVERNNIQSDQLKRRLERFSKLVLECQKTIRVK